MTDDMLELEPLSIVNQEFIKQLEGSRFKKKKQPASQAHSVAHIQQHLLDPCWGRQEQSAPSVQVWSDTVPAPKKLGISAAPKDWMEGGNWAARLQAGTRCPRSTRDSLHPYKKMINVGYKDVQNNPVQI